MLAFGKMKQSALPSNRKFGALFFVVLGVLGFYGIKRSWPAPGVGICFFLSVACGALAIFNSPLLTPFNKLWFKVGELMGKVVSPIVMGIIFFGIITPVSFFTRLAGRDELRMKPSDLKSYWIDRDPPGPESISFKNQF